MSNLEEPNGTPEGAKRDATAESISSNGLEQRVRELERENAALKADLAAISAKHDLNRDLLLSMIISDLPKNEGEYRELVANSKSFSELLREMEAEFGLESPK